MPDGVRLSARIWRPDDGAAVPAILEFLPYRKRDGTAARDALTAPWFAAHGYAYARVDLRGSGDSEGLLEDEYTAREHDDACAVIAWLAAQPWCSGRVGMTGISWGGFNALQVAARRPPALGAIVTVCSTDDRFADDVHAIGGAVHTSNLTWGATMMAYQSRPPDPDVVGDAWRAMWLERLRALPCFPALWLRHQRRDAYWRHGSVCEDFSAIACPVYAVGGWSDPYVNAIPRLLAGLAAPRAGLIGPWSHLFPHLARPGPAIGYLRETKRWWDRWLKDGDGTWPLLRAWLQDSVRPGDHAVRPGRWIAADAPGRRLSLFLTGAGLARAPAPDVSFPLCSPESLGVGSAVYCPHGAPGDEPLDQREDDGRSLLFDSPPLDAPLAVLGAPVLELDVASDRPVAKLVARLNDVHADGASLRVAHGVLNLTHRDGHAAPRALVPGQRVKVRVTLGACGHVFPAGHCIRVALSTALWPLTWSAPERVTLTVFAGAARLDLPMCEPSSAALPDFPPPEAAPPLARTALRAPSASRVASHDVRTGRRRYAMHDDSGLHRIDAHGLEYGTVRDNIFEIDDGNPLSARVTAAWRTETGRGDWRVCTALDATLTASATDFRVTATLRARENGATVLERDWDERIPRDFT